MRRVTEYRRYAEECRRLAAVLTKPADKRALELMAKGWDKSADAREAKLRGSDDLSEATLCGSGELSESTLHGGEDLNESTLRGSENLSEATSEPRQAAPSKRGHYCICS